MSVLNSHMQGFHSVIHKKNRIHTKKTYSHNKKTESSCVTNINIWVWLFELKRYWNTDLIIVPLPNVLLQRKHWHLDDLFAAQDAFHNAGNILRWWYLSIIVGVRWWFNPGGFVQSWTAADLKSNKKYNPNAFFLYSSFFFLICMHMGKHPNVNNQA